jgi:subtilisin family serine protease
VYESLDAVIATLNEDPDFRLLLQKLVLDFIEAIRAEQLARATSQFALDQINAAEAQSTATGRGVVVAVVDTGVYPTHWFLRDSVLPGIDLVDGDNDPTDVGNGHDDNGNGLVDEGVGHGTFIAGLIHLVAPDARILPIRVQNDEGDGWSFLVAEGIYRAVHAGANVVNLSLSVPATSEVLKSMVDYATQRGVVVVAAAGNDGEKVAMYPATYANVIGVAAVDSNNQKAVFSNYGNRGVDVAAPGVDLYGPYPVPGTTGMARWSGTSFSTALVSGEAALVFQVVSPRLTQSDPKAGGANVANVVMEKVLTTASSLRKSDPEFGTQMGRGLVNLQAAVAQ